MARMDNRNAALMKRKSPPLDQALGLLRIFQQKSLAKSFFDAILFVHTNSKT
jgi:hypothetical protein